VDWIVGWLEGGLLLEEDPWCEVKGSKPIKRDAADQFNDRGH
jgi:hypothetical protein